MSGLKARLLGVGFIAMGVALAWYFGLKPLEAARAGAAKSPIR